MKRIAILSTILFIVIAGGVFVQAAPEGTPNESSETRLEVTHTQNTNTVPLYDVFEITFQHEREYANPFFDVHIQVTFTAPSGEQIRVGGFHYGSSSSPKTQVRMIQTNRGRRRQIDYLFDKQDLWKARFAPSKLGKWNYNYVFTNIKKQKASAKGGFICVKGRRPNPGFVRRDLTNPFRWVFDDGSPYFPIGLQDCWGDNTGNGSVLDQCSMEGPFRTDLKDPPPLPPGPMFTRGPSNNPQNGDVYLRYFGQCGFNLYRFSQQNCSYVLYSDLDHYLVQEGIMTDELLRCARKYDFRIFYGLFGYQEVFNHEPDNDAGMAKIKRFVKYSVDRWGAYVDFWEFLNEQKADTGWYEIMIPYLRSIDPYHHSITTSWERPELPGIEINAPHWYQRENELESDVGDDENKNGIPDHEEFDFDGDGVDRSKSIPWDAFPFDPTEWRDTDGDGTGDNADTDDDGDGWSDEEEKRRGTDPLNRLSFPAGS